MTNRELLAFKDKLSAAKETTLSATAAVLEENETKIYAKIEALHKSYSPKDQKLVRLKQQLVADYALKDKDGYAIVREREINGGTEVDYDYGSNRMLVESVLLTWVANNTQRRQAINDLWDVETDVEFELVDDKDIPEELKEDLLPITRAEIGEISLDK